MKQGLRIVLTLVLLSLFLFSEIAAAYSWWQAIGAAATGGATGAVVGTVIPGLAAVDLLAISLGRL